MICNKKLNIRNRNTNYCIIISNTKINKISSYYKSMSNTKMKYITTNINKKSSNNRIANKKISTITYSSINIKIINNII